jgi:uncharacterized DUF497 family protein
MVSRKAVSNEDKHGVSFEEAATIFADPMALTIFDPDHNESDDRWITMGLSIKGRLLIVVHTFRDDNEGAHTIRIVSTRKASRHELKKYGEQS